MERVHVLYSGTVQGVGFRFTALRIARNLAIIGFVKNLHDGRVELVAEGELRELERLLEEIKTSGVGRYITNVTVDHQQATRGFSGFDVRS